MQPTPPLLLPKRFEELKWPSALIVSLGVEINEVRDILVQGMYVQGRSEVARLKGNLTPRCGGFKCWRHAIERDRAERIVVEVVSETGKYDESPIRAM